MSAAHGVALAVAYTWLGMVVAISFLEAPLKFRAEGVSLPIGLAIGRLVFRALNYAEFLLALILIVALAADRSTPAAVAGAVAIGTLAIQAVVVRPPLHRRSDAVLADPQDAALLATRSLAHHVYLSLEVIKCLALLLTGILLSV